MPQHGTPHPDLTILLPCLNEAATLGACLRAARQGITASGLTAELLVADNGSTDGSPEIALAEGARVIQVAARGYGHALRGGIAGAKGRWILMGDADSSYDFKAVPEFVAALSTGAEFVMGCRLPAGGGRIEKGAMPWLHRWLGNPALTWLGRTLFACPVHDFQCGLRAFSREAVQRLEFRTTQMEFASELVVQAHLAGLRFAEIPITLSQDGRNRPPHLRTWRDGVRHLRFLLLHRLRTLWTPARAGTHSRQGRRS